MSDVKKQDEKTNRLLFSIKKLREENRRLYCSLEDLRKWFDDVTQGNDIEENQLVRLAEMIVEKKKIGVSMKHLNDKLNLKNAEIRRINKQNNKLKKEISDLKKSKIMSKY